jgi:hypothetical protein
MFLGSCPGAPLSAEDWLNSWPLPFFFLLLFIFFALFVVELLVFLMLVEALVSNVL